MTECEVLCMGGDYQVALNGQTTATVVLGSDGSVCQVTFGDRTVRHEVLAGLFDLLVESVNTEGRVKFVTADEFVRRALLKRAAQKRRP